MYDNLKKMKNIPNDFEENLFTYPDSPGSPFRLVSTGTVRTRGVCLFQRSSYKYTTFEYVQKGSGFLDIDGQSYSLRQGDLYILQKGSSHKYWADKKDPWSKIYFIAEGALVESLLIGYALHEVFCFRQVGVEEIFTTLNSLGTREFPPEELHQQAALLFHQLLQVLYKNTKGLGKISPEIEGVASWLEGNIERKISLEDICLKAGLSSSTLTIKFRKYFGTTPYEYLLHKRIEAARLLLSHTRMPIKAIAARFYFADEYYFSNYFLKKTGKRPGAYRRESREGGQ